MNPRTIKRTDYYALVGLLTLAVQHSRALRHIETAAGELLGEASDNGDYGHVSDAIYGLDPNADLLLGRLGIGIEPPPLETGCQP